MFSLWEERTQFPYNLPLLSSPIPVIIIITSYTLFVFKYGKIFMNKRPAYDLRNVILGYNLLQIIYNGIMFSYFLKHIIINPVYDFRCMVTLPVEHPIKIIETSISYAFFINKYLDLLDTIFFVLRKSYKQITLLHVYHHIGMALGGYMILRTYDTGGHGAVMGTLNSLVHVFMYLYYFLSAISPNAKAMLWWKRYLTLMQLIQFVIIFLHTLYVIIFSTNCVYPRVWLWIIFTQTGTIFTMFLNFYIKTYMRPKVVVKTQTLNKEE